MTTVCGDDNLSKPVIARLFLGWQLLQKTTVQAAVLLTFVNISDLMNNMKSCYRKMR